MFKKIVFVGYCCLLPVFLPITDAQVSQRVDSLKDLLSKAGEDTGKVRLLNHLAGIYSESDTVKTFSYARQAIDLAGKLDDKAGMAKGYLLMGNGYYYTQNFKPALAYITKSLRISRKIKHKQLQGAALRDMGIVYNDWGAYAIAGQINILEDSLFGEEKMKNMDALQMYYETQKKEMQLAALEEESKLKTRLNYMGLAVIVIAAGFVTLLISRLRIRKKTYQAREQVQQLLQQRMETENQLQKAGQLRMKAKLELKNRELASAVLYLSRKNDLLNDLKCRLGSMKTHDGTAELKDIHKMIDNSLSLDQDWEKFTLHFDNVHPDFFKKLQSRYPGLTPNELKECAYMKINLSTKEIANLLNISPESIKTRRHRIKKKLNLRGEQNLPAFIASL